MVRECVDPYASDVDAETFDLDGYLATFDPAMLASVEGRRELTRLDPLAFGLLYLPHHLRGADGSMSLADPHLDWARLARTWVGQRGGPRGWRHSFIAPRDTGKSTWFYLIIPMWAGAHGWEDFFAAFADSGSQAALHLQSFKRELDANQLLRYDFPELCRAARRPSGVSESDSQVLYIAASGFVFAAKGIDAKNLGLKVGSRRPGVIVLDDVEPDESSYSAYQRDKRLRTIQDAILPLNERARVVLVGTVTMPGSVTHQTVKFAKGAGEPAEWIREQKFVCHHYDAIISRPDGSERSTWPEKWPLEYLISIRHTRSYKKNFANDPAASTGAYWAERHFRYGDLPGVTRTLLSVDPATTTKTTSDPTGLAVIGWKPARKVTKEELAAATDVQPRRVLKAEATTGRCVVRRAWAVRLVGEELRTALLRTLAEYPEIRLILVESNQGGEHWHAILHDMPVKVAIVHNSEPKDVRAADLLHHYEMERVLHEEQLPACEEQMTGFPQAAHDDMVDAVGNGVFRFIPPAGRKKPVRATAQSRPYV
jgi:hypothetical protein